ANGVVRGLDLDAVSAAREVIPEKQHRAERQNQPVGKIECGLRRVRLWLGLERAENADTHPQHVHRMRADGELLQCGLHACGQPAQSAQALLVVIELGTRRQLAVEQKVRDLFKVTLCRKIENVIAAVVKVVAGAADGAERGIARRNAGERNRLLRFESGSGRGSGCFTHGCTCRFHDRSLAKSSSSFCSYEW